MSVLQVSERICEQVLDQTLLLWEIELVLTILLLIPNHNHLHLAPSVISFLPLSQPAAPISPFSVPPAVQTLSTLMKLDSSSRPRGPLTEAEKQFQKQRGVCNYCGTDALGTACAKLAQRDAVRAARFPVKSDEMSLLPTLTSPSEE